MCIRDSDAAIHHGGAAKTCPESYHEDVITVFAGTEFPLSIEIDAGVVVDIDRDMEAGLHPGDDGYFFPFGKIRGKTGDAVFDIQDAGNADAHAGDVFTGQMDFIEKLYDGGINAFQHLSLIHISKIDGAGVIPILTNIYLPLSKPILAVVSVYTIVGRWNSWFDALVYLPRTEWQPLQLFLRRILVESTKQVTDVLDPQMAAEMVKKQMSGAQLKYAMIIFTTLPVLFTYPFFQKYFVKGVMLGSLKE